jgi:AcrR family transcriptional regulator
MPKVTEQHRLAKHDEILEAALRAFRRKGFQATSMAEIIAESGMSAGAIYGHFGGKADIVREGATTIVSARMDDLEKLSQLDPMPRPGEMVRTVIEGFVEPHGWPAVLLQVWGEAVTDPSLREVANESFARVRVAFASYVARWHQQAHGLSETDARRLGDEQAPLFLSAIHGFVVQDSLFEGFDRADYLAKTLPFLPA